MRPDEIRQRDFLVGLRGYDRDEVRGFLADVAANHAALLDELAAAKAVPAVAPAAPAPAPADDLENLGASVAAILRTAKDAAAEITEAAEAHAQQTRTEIEDLRYRAVVEADQLRAEAQAVVEAAHAEAERIVAEADARLNGRAEEALRREAVILARLREVGDELQLALMALESDDVVDVREVTSADSVA